MRLPGVCQKCRKPVVYNGVAWLNPGRREGVHRCRRRPVMVSYAEGKHMPSVFIASDGHIRCADCLQRLRSYPVPTGRSWRHYSDRVAA